MQSKGRVERELINTKHILFIVSGAFTGLRDIIEQRVSRGALGLGGELKDERTDSEYLAQVATEDLIEFGFEPEFVGRLPVRVTCHELSEKDLFDILKYSEGSILKQYRQAFRSYNSQFCFDDSGLKEIAKKAFAEKTGARGLVTVLETLLRDYKFELPSTSVQRFTLSSHLANHPQRYLKTLISRSNMNKLKKGKASCYKEIMKFEDSFYKKHGIKINFHTAARDEIISKAKSQGVSIAQICEEVLSSSEHGFNLIKKNTGQSEFELTKDVVKFPKSTLEDWVKASYTNSHLDHKTFIKGKGSKSKKQK